MRMDRLRDMRARSSRGLMRGAQIPYGGRGNYMVQSNRGRNTTGLDYGSNGRDYRGSDYEYDARYNDQAYTRQNYADRNGDYEYNDQYNMAHGDYGDMRDMHYAEKGQTYRPVEAMGYFTGYYGSGDDMARGGRGRDRGYDMGYDYNYEMNYDYARRGGRRDYGDYSGDYGEKLTKEELEQWRKKLDKEVGDEQSKQFFKKENIEQKARQMGLEMKHFNAEELALAGYMLYSDYCKSLKPYIGQNMDVFIKMGEEFLMDPDSAVKGGEKLALYYAIVSGEDD